MREPDGTESMLLGDAAVGAKVKGQVDCQPLSVPSQGRSFLWYLRIMLMDGLKGLIMFTMDHNAVVALLIRTCAHVGLLKVRRGRFRLVTSPTLLGMVPVR